MFVSHSWLPLILGCSQPIKVGGSTVTGTTDVSDSDSDSDSGSDTLPPQEVTIHEIQEGEVPEGQAVIVEGVVTGVAPTGLYVEEPAGGPLSGIWVYAGSGWDEVYGSSVAGDQLRVTGQYQEYYGLTEISLADGATGALEHLGTAAVPAPELLTAADLGEDWESVLVEVHDLEVVNPDVGYGDFSASDGTGTVRVDDQIYRFGLLDNNALTAGFRLALVRGPLNYSFEAFLIEPRDSTDVVSGLFVHDVQQGAVADGDDVTLTGVVVTAVGAEGVFVEELAGGQYSGIWVYLGVDWDAFWGPIAVGDVLDVAGQFLEFYGRSEVNVPAGQAPEVVVTGIGAVPAPEVLTAALLSDPTEAERWEGVLVQVNDVTVDQPDLLGYQFDVVDSASPAGAVAVDDTLHQYSGYDTLVTGDAFSSITGPLDYGFAVFTILPRDESDLVP